MPWFLRSLPPCSGWRVLGCAEDDHSYRVVWVAYIRASDT
jgi:hypothetical protein